MIPSQPTRSPEPGAPSPAGWSLLLLALPVGLALGVTTWSGVAAAREAAAALVREQGDSLARPIRAKLRGERAALLPTEADLAEFVAGAAGAAEPGEAHHLLVFEPRSGGTASVGRSRLGADRVRSALLSNGQGYVEEGAGVALIVKRLIPNEALRDVFPERKVPPEAASRIAIEFVPTAARELERAATRTLVVGLSAIALLAITSFRLARVLRKRAALERDLAGRRQLAALGEMSVVLAHEIRNPLASLKGHAQLLEESLGDVSPERKKAQRIVGEALRLERLCVNLLDFVRSAQVSPTPTPVAELLGECAAEVPEVEVQVRLDEAPERWNLDPLRMRQVLVNLLRNAGQASPAGAPVEVEVRSEGEAGGLLFCVRDRGPGFEPGAEERAFEAFHTTRTRGTGLGLAVARRVVELHGGTISARNRPEGGAEVRVLLPGSAAN